jgi:ADP-heptose:LPS heptosyltransferase
MRFIKNIRSDNYDLTISFPREYNDRKNAFLSYFSGAKVRIGTNEDFLGKIFYTDLIKGDFYKEAWVERGIHYICEVKKVLSKKQGIDKVNDVNNILKNNCLFINKKIKERVKQRWQFLTKNDKKVVGIVNGSDERKRRFPKKFLYALLQELKKTLNNKVKVVMIDDAFKEFNALRKKDEDIQQQNNFYILLPDSVQGLVAVIGECDLVISNDTAGMHIANVFKKKLIAVFGPYLASSRIQAEKGRVSVVKPRNLPCYPCNKSAKMPCRGELYCYKEERIIPQIMEKLKYLL